MEIKELLKLIDKVAKEEFPYSGATGYISKGFMVKEFKKRVKKELRKIDKGGAK